MTGSVQHIEGDRYRVIVYAGRDPHTGRERYRSRSFRADGIQKAKKAATGIATALLAEIEHGKADRKTVAGFVDAWIQSIEHDLSPSTMKGYRQIAKVVVGEFGRMRLDEVKPSDVRRWYGRLAAQGMSQSTVRHYGTVLKIIFNLASNDREIVKAPTDGVKLPKLDEPVIHLPTDAAMMAIIGRATGDLLVAFKLAAATGMRRGELVALRWSDLHGRDFHVARAHVETRGKITVKSTKGKRGRVVALDDATMRMLARHRRAQVGQARALAVELDKRADRPILANLAADPKGGVAYPPTWLSHGWMRVRKAAGAEHVNLHQLRHWHATSLLNAGVPLHVVSPRLGHADPSVTMRVYSHSDRDADRAAARKIALAMKALPAP